MVGLIVSVFSIMLVALVCAIGMYFGGSTSQDGRVAADAAKLLIEGSQIAGAAQVFQAQEGAYATNLTELVSSEYLSRKPQSLWGTYKDTAVFPGIALDRCQSLNAKHGIEGIPLCTSASVPGKTVCCEQP